MAPFGFDPTPAHLVLAPGTSSERPIPIYDRLFVGRECTGVDESRRFLIDDERVSRTHLEIVLDQDRDQGWLVDRSANGIELNGRRVVHRVPIRINPGDRLTVGPAEFSFRSHRFARSRASDTDKASRMGLPAVEIREPGRAIRVVVLDRAIEVGRECDGERIDDDEVSRRHLKLLPSPTGLSVVDLGSRNGTQLNGSPMSGRNTLAPGDVLRLGRTDIVVLACSTAPRAGSPDRRTHAITPTEAAWLPTPPKTGQPARPGRGAKLLQRVFATSKTGGPLSASFMQLPTRVSPRVWRTIRATSIVCYLMLCVALFVRPSGALFTFFNILVPLLPITFFVAPGLWRNICPLAAANQAPRGFGFTRAMAPPRWLRQRGFLIAMALFFGIVGARVLLFNTVGAATGVLLSLTIISAFAGGIFFRGKSGWCSSICPLLPLQRVYGQTPFVTVPNSHCRPCVACTKNCYDFKPRAAYQADLQDADPGWAAPRKLFAAALPGFVLGFFAFAARSDLPTVQAYQWWALCVLCSAGSFYIVDALLPGAAAVVSAVYAAAAINIFYWYACVTLAGSLAAVTGVSIPWVRWPLRVALACLTIIWIARTYLAHRDYARESAAGPQLIPLTVKPPPPAPKAHSSGDAAEVCFVGHHPVTSECGMSLLEVAEREGHQIESGCRMGVCGADPVAVVDGMNYLSAPGEEELDTLRRLGLAETTRMACCARLAAGSVTVSLTPEPGVPVGSATPARFDRSIVSVVILGNGIAGVTAADFVRRGHPDCEIHIVGQEPHVLYNRMGISRLVYHRSAMAGLSLIPEQWYDEHGVTAWLNTLATRIDLNAKRVFLGTGDVLPFDRLILATGSGSSVPAVDGFGRPGSFLLREAADAMAIRAYAQSQHCREALVAGGGLLGLEAAYALHELGLHVTVLERRARLLSRQIDPRCSQLVHAYFDSIGIDVLYESQAAGLLGEPNIDTAVLTDGRHLRSDLFLGCIGIRPHLDLAAEAGIPVKRGVIVDDRMQTGVPGVFAAGDVAEHNGLVLGLWPIAAKQAQIAATNALGNDLTLKTDLPTTILKGVGLELFSIGRIEVTDDDEVIATENRSDNSYLRLVLTNGKASGAVVLGRHPREVTTLSEAVRNEKEFAADVLSALRGGNWRVLETE